ncbi:hypothetical protein FS749_010901 [Ceratobasidium sp. UAMH 11750]|nr:hypothetical protein FS749_010901 [Ceratobasidium sp. UAMH 11750]
MRLLGRLATTAVADATPERFDLEMLQRFYGADGDIRHPHQGTSGAGAEPGDAFYLPVGLADLTHDEPEDFSGYSEQELETLAFIRQQLQSQQEKHVRHPPVKVPRHHNPFSSPDMEIAFWEALQAAEQEGYTPWGYGVHPEEWEGGVYPEIEVIKGGNRKKGELEIGLPTSVWFPRAVCWAWALHIMSFTL